MIMRKTVLCCLLAAMVFCTSCGAPAPGFLPGETAAPGYVLPDIDPVDAPSDDSPLINRNYYKSVEDIDLSVEELYIEIYPTYNEESELLTRKAFEKHRSRDKSYNPTLNAHIWQGNPNDPANRDGRLGFDDPDYNCTIRVRGNSTRGLSVKNFKVKLTQPGARLYGYDSLNLNKHIMDDTRTNNKMSMDLLQLMQHDFSSMQTKFIRLYINDVGIDGSQTGFQDQGLYIWVEQPGVDYLKNHGLDPNGSLYKAESFEFRRYPDQIRTEDDPLYNQEEFESVIKSMCNPDHEKLIRMLDAINDYSINFSETFYRYFDEDNYLAWLGTNILFGNKDAVAHNFLLYSPSGSEKWYFLPWDYDSSLEDKEITEWNDGYYQVFGVHIFWAVPFHQRYLRMEGSVEKISACIDEMMQTVFTESNIIYLSEEYLKVLREFFMRDTDYEMLVDYHIGRRLRRLTPEEIAAIMEEDVGYEDDSFWFRVRSAEDPFSIFFPRRIEGPILNRYSAVQNSYDRFYLTLQSPTAGYIQEPVKTDDGWIFRWDAAFDFQQDRVTYELIIAKDVELTDIVLRATNITSNEYLVDFLPEGDIYYRFIARDAQGYEQYPLNIAFYYTGDTRTRYNALAHFYNDGTY